MPPTAKSAYDYGELTRQWFERVWNQKRAEAIDTMMAKDALVHGLGEPIHGPAGFRVFHQTFLGAFPDTVVQVDDVISDGDKTSVRFTMRGTHRGNHLGFPATGKAVETTGLGWIRWRDGKIVEGWNEFDSAGKISALRT